MEEYFGDIIKKAYAAFNERNIDEALATMQPDVLWSKAWEGGYISGHDEIKEYWTRQWAEINPRVEPAGFLKRSNGSVEVLVHQIVKDLHNNLVFDGMVRHIYTFQTGRIQTMEIELDTEQRAASPDTEIITTRTFDFPRNVVYSAWSDPDHLKNWWGPNGFTNTFEEFDLRPGGKWRFIMHGPDKGNYQNECEFTRVDKPAFISWKRISKPLFQVAVLFEEVLPAKTKITFRMIFDSVEECNKLKPFVVDKNEENFDKLETELAKMV